MVSSFGLDSDFSYPFRVSNGIIEQSYGANVVRDRIRALLETVEGEFVMQPSVGLPHFVFETSNMGLVVERVRSQLIELIDDAEFFVAGSYNEDGRLVINVEWEFRGVEQEAVVFGAE